MFVRRFLFVLRASLLLALPATARAHGPFDHNARVWVFEDHLEVTVTLGPEAAKIFLNDGPEEVLRSGQMEIAFPFPASSAARLFEIKSGDTVLKPLKSDVRSDGLEYNFGLFYPRPDSGTLSFTARYMSETPTLTKGSLVVVDENGSALAGKVLSADNRLIEFTLPAKAGANLVVQNAVQTIAPIAAPAVAATIPPPAPSVGVRPRWRLGLITAAAVTLALLIGLSLRARQRPSN